MDEEVETGGKLVCFYGRYRIRDIWSGNVERTGKSIYGTDYKAEATSDYTDQVGITRLRKQLTKNDREFEFEVYLLGHIRHLNLLAMKGYYLGPEGGKLLVFDYMPEGSLAALLHDTLETTKTLGYQAPEVSMLHKVDRNSDVCSFGVIMLELLTGKSPGDVDLRRWVDTIVKEEWNDKVFDHEMMKDVSANGEVELSKSLQLALKCVNQSLDDRPHFQLVLELLEAIRPETTTSSG